MPFKMVKLCVGYSVWIFGAV